MSAFVNDYRQRQLTEAEKREIVLRILDLARRLNELPAARVSEVFLEYNVNLMPVKTDNCWIQHHRSAGVRDMSFRLKTHPLPGAV